MDRRITRNLAATFGRPLIAFIPILMSRFIFDSPTKSHLLVDFYLYLAQFSIVSLSSTLGLGAFYISQSLNGQRSAGYGNPLQGFRVYSFYGICSSTGLTLLFLLLGRADSLHSGVLLLISLPFAVYIGYASMRALAEFSLKSQISISIYQAIFLTFMGLCISWDINKPLLLLLGLVGWFSIYCTSLDIRNYVEMLLGSAEIVIRPLISKARFISSKLDDASSWTIPDTADSPSRVHLLQGVIGSISQPLYVFIATLSLSELSQEAESIFRCSRFTDALVGVYVIYASNRLGSYYISIKSDMRDSSNEREGLYSLVPKLLQICGELREIPLLWVASCAGVYLFILLYYGDLTPIIAAYDFGVSSIKFLLLVLGMVYASKAPFIAIARDIGFLLVSFAIFLLSRYQGLGAILTMSISGFALTLIVCLIMASMAIRAKSNETTTAKSFGFFLGSDKNS